MLTKYFNKGEHPIRLVILDDDPTGIQTVHGCLLLTQWDDDSIRNAFQHKAPFFYILTNTRAMTREDAAKVIEEAMEAVIRVNREFGYKLICISRSDSTLRGHFPLETDVMTGVMHKHEYKTRAKQVFCPAFIEAGRVTIDGIHYMKEGDKLIPVSETEFAHDNVFAYSTSVLTEYIKEKGSNPDDYEIVNAQSYEELKTFCESFLQEMASNDCHAVIRCSSSLPKSMSGIADKELLTREELRKNSGEAPGCFIVGSHVKKTTMQLENLLSAEGTIGIELSIERILDDVEALMAETTKLIADYASEGLTPVVFTARKEVRINDADKRQRLGQTVSDFLVNIVRNLPYTPAYLIAKGGITSHDILTHGLSVRSALVMGQILSGVPCIMTDKFPYTIFPGNVGNEDALKDAYLKIR